MDRIVERIQQMERIFDALQAAAQSTAANDPAHGELLAELIRYYEGGQWLRDYEADERGELPADLKRGVLSQDAVFDLLANLEERNEGAQ